MNESRIFNSTKARFGIANIYLKTIKHTSNIRLKPVNPFGPARPYVLLSALSRHSHSIAYEYLSSSQVALEMFLEIECPFQLKILEIPLPSIRVKGRCNSRGAKIVSK